MNLSIVMLTWNRPAALLENSLWTLCNQSSGPPLEIIVTEASPDPSRHAETRQVCARYAPVKLIEAWWPRFNISRGFNVGIRNSDEKADWLASTCMELLFAENFLEVVQANLQPDSFLRVACGSLWADADTSVGPPQVRARWDEFCRLARPYPPPIAYGAFVCAPREWWLRVHGYDELRRPYSYPDIDIQDRALRSGLREIRLGWEVTQCLHPYHPPSGLFYEVSGYPVDNEGIDKEIVRNGENWGAIGG